jgi:hypothetical protein
MDEPEISLPAVRACVADIVHRWMYKFRKFNDIDEESLYADVWGSLVKAHYNPDKSAPQTFARNVVVRRMMDILRSRLKKVHSYNGPEDIPDRAFEPEDPEAELTLLIGQYYRSTVAYLPLQMQEKERRVGRPTPTIAQKAAITWLVQKMQWSYRDARDNFQRFPSILAEIGVTEPKSHQFFFRTIGTVTKFLKKEKKVLAIGLPQPTAA